MFEIRIFVDDKQVPGVLWALDGKVVGAPNIIPVRAAKASNGKVVSTQPLVGSTLCHQVADYILKQGWGTVTTKQFQEAAKAVGAAPTTIPGLRADLRKWGFLDDVAPGGRGNGRGNKTYRVNAKAMENA